MIPVFFLGFLSGVCLGWLVFCIVDCRLMAERERASADALRDAAPLAPTNVHYLRRRYRDARPRGEA